MINQKISSNLQGFPMLKSPNLDVKGKYECVLSKYPETNAILITNNTISLLDSKPDLILDEKKFNWFLNCTGFALRIDDSTASQPGSQNQNQKSIFSTALNLYLKWIIKNPIYHLLNQEKWEEYVRLFLVHLSQIFLNPSFNFQFTFFKKQMFNIFIKSHPSISEETWATLIKVLLCGSCDYASTTEKENFTELALLGFKMLLNSTFKSESFLTQFDSLIHKLFTFPSFSREVWLKLFEKVYNPIVESYFYQIAPEKIGRNQRRQRNSSVSENDRRNQNKQKTRKESDVEKAQLKKLNDQLIFEFIREKINQEFSKEHKQEAFSKAIHCWYNVSEEIDFPVHPKWPTDEIKSLFLSWFSIDCEWEDSTFHPLFTLIMRGERETTPDLQKIAKNLIVNVLEKTTFDHETPLFWYLPVYAYDFLMNNLTFLDSLELSFQNFAVRFESSKMTANFDIHQHLLFILIRLVQRTKSDDIRNTMTNLAVSSEYKSNMMLMITSILSMVVIRRGDLFWSQINKCFSNRYSSTITALLTKESFSKIILIAGFVPLILRSDFSTNINIDPFFWDLLETILNKNYYFNDTNFDSHIPSRFLNSASGSASNSGSHLGVKSFLPIFSQNSSFLDTNLGQNQSFSQLNLQQQLQQQQQQINPSSFCSPDFFNATETANMKSSKIAHASTVLNFDCNNHQDDFLKSIEQQKVLLGLFCLSQGTDLFTSHPENNSRLLNLLAKPKYSQKDPNSSLSYQNLMNMKASLYNASNNNSAGGSNASTSSLINTISNLRDNAINSISYSIFSANNSSMLINNNNNNSTSNIPNVNSTNLPNMSLIGPSSQAAISASSSAFNNINDENDDLESKDVSELKTFREMTQLSVLCGGSSFNLDTLNNDMSGYTENFVTKKFILSVIGKNHIVIRHGLGINVFHIEDLGGRECYKGGIPPSEESKLFVTENKDKDEEEEEEKTDLYVSPFDDDEGLLEAFKDVDSMFNNNEKEEEEERDERDSSFKFKKPPEKTDVSDAHSLLCDLGFISADSSMNTRHISTGCFSLLEKLDKTSALSTVDVFVYQLLDDNDRIIINRNKNKETKSQQQQQQQQPYPSQRNQYSSLAYSLTNRGKRTKNLEELMKYLNSSNDCGIATIVYHMPIFDDEADDFSDSFFDDIEFNEPSKKASNESMATDSSANDIDNQSKLTIENEKSDQSQQSISSDEKIAPADNNSNQQTQEEQNENDFISKRRLSPNRRRGTIHSISTSQANQIGFLLLLNETGMVINPKSPELNNFECVIAITPQSNNDDNYVVDFLTCESTFFAIPNLRGRRFYTTKENIGWIVSLAAVLFYATPGQTTETGYTHMRSPSHFTSGYVARSNQIKKLFNRSESGRNTILVGCLSCGIKQSQ